MDSIIFDLDGTIWDPIDTVLDAWNKALEQDDRIDTTFTRADLEGVMGLQVKEMSAKLMPELKEADRLDIMDRCFELEEEQIRKQGGALFPQVEEVLDRLSDTYDLFIVSNCQDGYIESFYEYHKLERYFKDYENPGRTGLSKGENIKLVIDRNNLDDPVYVGDTNGDEKAASDAGIPFVYAAYGFGEVEGYDKKIEAFKDLEQLF
ncbi:HAD family hydrolase [Halobacillus sp. BAB-2008]|uniref:HAD family hydrolase n=1 Tax=Halobacillus sp. BAB-2008 TaxID=1246484 RepID=UPI0002A4DC3F|nr:HAD family hydrolase [Halobacillus sp. BAB-2008]ELK44864.1 hypothetical protein D479_17474 [Halobacillus sp. BAB-2008]